MVCGTWHLSVGVLHLDHTTHGVSEAYNASNVMSKPAIQDMQSKYCVGLSYMHLYSARKAVSCTLASAASTKMLVFSGSYTKPVVRLSRTASLDRHFGGDNKAFSTATLARDVTAATEIMPKHNAARHTTQSKCTVTATLFQSWQYINW
jgi:hypothetical protein